MGSPARRSQSASLTSRHGGKRIVVLGGRRILLQHDVDEDFHVYKCADLYSRGYAFLIDIFLAGPLFELISNLLAIRLEAMQTSGRGLEAFAIHAGLFCALLTGFWIWPTFATGQTLGKRIVGLRVVTTGRDPRVGFFRVLARETVAKALSLLPFGLGAIGVLGRARMALHDRLTGTVVIQFREGVIKARQTE